MALKAPPRHRPEAEAPPTPKSDMEKNIDSLLTIRKGRLERKEVDYRKAVNEYNIAKKAVMNAEEEIETARKNASDEKDAMFKKNLNLTITQNHLFQWMERENHLDGMILESVQKKGPKEREMQSFKEKMDAKKREYDKALQGIEKLDILKREIHLENSNT